MKYKNNDIEDLIAEVSEKVNLICVQTNYEEIKKVTIKNTLENLRSILDYIAQDVLNALNNLTPINTKKYFPYGKTQVEFENSLNRNSFSHLSNLLPEVYELFLAQQPFVNNDNWLIDLCNLCNEVKHNNLVSSQEQKETNVIQPGFINIQNGRNVFSYGNTMNGIPLDDFIIDHNGGVLIKRNSGNTIVIQKNKIIFHGKNIEIKAFFGTCLDNINNLYQGLTNIEFNS